MTRTLPAPHSFVRRSIPALFLSLVLASGQAVAADSYSDDSWKITADTIINYGEQQSLVAMGNVRAKNLATGDSQDILSDWLSYDLESGTIRLRGNVKRENFEEQYDNFLIGPNELARENSYISLAGLGAWLMDDQTSEPIAQAPEKGEGEIVENIEFTPEVEQKKVTFENSGVSIARVSPVPKASQNNQNTAATKPTDTREALKPTPGKILGNTLSTEAWDIAADKITRLENPDQIIATGNVILVKREIIPPKPVKEVVQRDTSWDDLLGTPANVNTEPQVDEVPTGESEREYKEIATIYTDYLKYDVDGGIIEARGNVRIDNEDNRVLAQEATIQVESELGSFEKASLRQEDFLYLEGEKVEKTGYQSYRITDGWVITCKLEEGEAPPWAIVSAQADVEREGYAVLKHARFHVKGIPVFYTPYMVIPVKETRQTGFLYPELSQNSKNGFGIHTPFFWAISDSVDATFYPQYYSDRGFMPGAEFRYIKSANEKGTINLSYLHDSMDAEESNHRYNSQDRYWIRGKADHTFNNQWISRVDLDWASDIDFLDEFGSGMNSFDRNQEEYLASFGRGFQNEDEEERANSVHVLRSWDTSYLEMKLLAVNDLRLEDNTLKDKEYDKPFWQLPNISYSGTLPVGDTSLSLDWGSQYVYFWREDGYGGHRLDFSPSLAMGIPLSPYLESRAEVGIRGTYYSMTNNGTAIGNDKWTGDDHLDRFSYNFEYEIATTLERDYAYADGGGLTNQIRPYVRYNYTPEDEEQNDTPFFDMEDRIDEENGITYGFDTYFDRFGEVNRRLAHFEMYQTFYLDEVTEYNDDADVYDGPLKDQFRVIKDDFSEITAKISWYPWRNTYIGYKTEFDPNGLGFISHTFDAQHNSDNGNTYGMTYSYKNDESFEYTEAIDEINAYMALRMSNDWYIDARLEHSLIDEDTQELDLGLTYDQPCWSATFLWEHEPEDDTFGIVFKLANIGVPIGISN